MPSLTLKREARYGSLRMLKIEINAHKTVSLGYKQEKNIDLPTGMHTLVAKMSWTKSIPLPVVLAENEHKRILIMDAYPLWESAIRALIPPFVIYTLKENS